MLIYVVKPGDSLWRIANSYRVSANSIITVNQLPNPNRLVPGQALVIPTEDIFYTVKAGDTLWNIAQNYGTTIQAILQSNQITNPAAIHPGMTLIIPAPRYRVQAGDTLWQIAQRYGVDLQTLMEVNNITDPTSIYPGMVLVIPLRQRPAIYVNGYTIATGEGTVPIVQDVGRLLTYVSQFAYRIQSDGGLGAIDDNPMIRTAYQEKVIPMMSITNFSSTETGSQLAHDVLSNPAAQRRLVDNILGVMKQKGYQGLNIDFENVFPADRELYNQFLQLAADSLHPQGYFVSSALAPKTSANQPGLLYEAHDYPAHGRILDFVVLMTYEWGYRFGPPQAISPINQIRRVLDYAVTVIPRDEIFFGFQIYARDWLLPHVQGQEAETFSPQEAITRAVRYGAVIQYDSVAQAPFFRYTDEQGRRHEVWFEDARSAQAKFDTVKQYGLKGISYWVLGYSYPQNWALLADNFRIVKLM